MDQKIHSVIIIGSGPAGYTAAIYAARASLEPLLIQGPQPGGQLTVTTDVENYPGFAKTIQGPWLMEQMEQQAINVGTKTEFDMVERVDFSKTPREVITASGKTYKAHTVIICTGAQAKWLGLPSEKKFRGFGVSGCATCDAFFFKEKKVFVIGGGNTAVEEAIFLANTAKEVTLVHRRDTLRAEKILQKRLRQNPKIKILWNTTVEEIIGSEEPFKKVTHIRLKNKETQEKNILAADGVFVAIGHSPATQIFKGQLDTVNDGYIVTKPGTTKTAIPGIYAAGDVCDPIYRQAVTSAGFGCMAALDALKYLQENDLA